MLLIQSLLTLNILKYPIAHLQHVWTINSWRRCLFLQVFCIVFVSFFLLLLFINVWSITIGNHLSIIMYNQISMSCQISIYNMGFHKTRDASSWPSYNDSTTYPSCRLKWFDVGETMMRSWASGVDAGGRMTIGSVWLVEPASGESEAADAMTAGLGRGYRDRQAEQENGGSLHLNGCGETRVAYAVIQRHDIQQQTHTNAYNNYTHAYCSKLHQDRGKPAIQH